MYSFQRGIPLIYSHNNKIFTKQEINDIAVDDPIVICHDSGNVRPNDDFPEEIVGEPQGILFRRFFFSFWHLPCRLDIHPSIPAVDDKVNLFLLVLSVPAVSHNTHIHSVSAAQKLNVNQVLHHVTGINLPEAQARVPKAHICKIILVWVIKI